MKIPYITLVNLLAGEEVYPEFATDRDPSEAVAARVLEILTNPDRRCNAQEKTRQHSASGWQAWRLRGGRTIITDLRPEFKDESVAHAQHNKR